MFSLHTSQTFFHTVRHTCKNVVYPPIPDSPFIYASSLTVLSTIFFTLGIKFSSNNYNTLCKLYTHLRVYFQWTNRCHSRKSLDATDFADLPSVSKQFETRKYPNERNKYQFLTKAVNCTEAEVRSSPLVPHWLDPAVQHLCCHIQKPSLAWNYDSWLPLKVPLSNSDLT